MQKKNHTGSSEIRGTNNRYMTKEFQSMLNAIRNPLCSDEMYCAARDALKSYAITFYRDIVLYFFRHLKTGNTTELESYAINTCGLYEGTITCAFNWIRDGAGGPLPPQANYYPHTNLTDDNRKSTMTHFVRDFEVTARQFCKIPSSVSSLPEDNSGWKAHLMQTKDIVKFFSRLLRAFYLDPIPLYLTEQGYFQLKNKGAKLEDYYQYDAAGHKYVRKEKLEGLLLTFGEELAIEMFIHPEYKAV